MPAIETLVLPQSAPGALNRVLHALRQGKAVALPTDTVYGLAADALQPDAVRWLYTVKARPAHLAIPLLLPDAATLSDVCLDIPSLAWELARQFWPGALTLVLHRKPSVPDAITAGGPHVAVRVPDHALARDLCRRLGHPLAATSANLHGQPEPHTAAQVLSTLRGLIPLILDGGPSPGGVASTVLNLTSSPPAILRPGPVTVEQLAPFLTRPPGSSTIQ
jgi:L-threonylcarbamoyladenylate synthase